MFILFFAVVSFGICTDYRGNKHSVNVSHLLCRVAALVVISNSFLSFCQRDTTVLSDYGAKLSLISVICAFQLAHTIIPCIVICNKKNYFYIEMDTYSCHLQN